ncbi:phospho-acceptor domain-containing protein [Pseudoduganella lurida]|uniref:histidine kinase n=1 Tax=Pseudoduganella lurida TaxID=1036180 RepID=A0A562RLL5_9BURK|nr:response regulator [Pseudoduganella lurida]TWI69494.1 phospho-acceptor domain-containing protein [Pseudoduganella lurida]
MSGANPAEQRVLVLAPHGRDAEVIGRVVGRDGVACETVPDLAALTEQVAAGAAAAIVAQEALVGGDAAHLQEWLQNQPPWSDFPFVVLLSTRAGTLPPRLRAAIGALGNVVLLERPLSAETLGSAADSALRARRRQYQARQVLAEREEVSGQLVALNATLEARVDERTRALAQANDRLTAEVIGREKAQQAMVQFQKMESLGRLTGGVAHDFNNLLNIVQGTMELILMMSKDDAVRARAQTAKAACERGAKLTAQLLTFARNQTLDLRPLPVAPLFDAVTELARPLLGHSIELLCSIGPDVDCVLADASQMEMALLNLVINARDAMPEGGRLIMRASRGKPPDALLTKGDYVRLAVSDNGAGMPEDVMAKVFEPFFTTKGVGKGTGLGLSQVYGMAQQSGGIARIESAPGHGTTVEIWLPAATAEAAERQPEPAARNALQGARVLVVEDDELVRTGMVDALLALGCEVTQAASGDEAVTMLAERQPQLLLTDYLMPGMTGAELADRARAAFPDLPVVVATGYADMEAVQRAVGQGAVLRKPFHMAELAAAVERGLQGARA